MKKTAFMGLFLAFALILGYVESLIPFSFGIPGIKLGLPNFAIVMILYLYGDRESLAINFMRIILSAFMFGNMSTLLYSLVGGMLSNIVMILCKKMRFFSMISVSMMGGIFHNIGQLIVAYFVVRTIGIVYYAPVLIVVGMITGLLIGMIQDPIQKRIKGIIYSNQ